MKNFEIINTNKISLEEGWMREYISPLDYECNLKRYSNWMAVVDGFDDNGKQKRRYLKESNDSDTVFFVKGHVKEGDVVAMGCHDNYKPYHSQSRYFKVFAINEEEMELSEAQTTYLKAKNLTKELE